MERYKKIPTLLFVQAYSNLVDIVKRILNLLEQYITYLQIYTRIKDRRIYYINVPISLRKIQN